ncbi:MAG: hypothetical protein ABIL76_04310 [candidate division WOR-3 bacterium]
MKEINNEIHAIDVIQSIQTTKTPLTIIIISGGNKFEKMAKIYVNDRKIYHAEYESYVGIEALKRIIKLPIKRVYIIKTNNLIKEKTIDLKVDEALLNLTFQSSNLPALTTFVDANSIVNELQKIGSIICILYYFESDKSEIIEIEYIDNAFSSKKIEIADRISEFIKKFGKFIEQNETLILEREIVYIFHKTISTYLVIVAKNDIQIDIVRVILKKII